MMGNIFLGPQSAFPHRTIDGHWCLVLKQGNKKGACIYRHCSATGLVQLADEVRVRLSTVVQYTSSRDVPVLSYLLHWVQVS